MTLVMQGDQRAGEQERAGEGDGKAETGRRTEAKRSRGDHHHHHHHDFGDQDHHHDGDACLHLILSRIGWVSLCKKCLHIRQNSGGFKGERRDEPGVQASAC